MALPVPSAGRRLLKMIGFALVQALLFGGVIGLWVYLRPVRQAEPDPDANGSLIARVVAPLDSLERALYDWRARELGRASHPSEQVVVVAVDDETLANARQDPHPELASRPWPRSLLGGMVELLTREGARSVLVDLPLADATPHSQSGDDDRFRQSLEAHPGQSVLGFGWSNEVQPPVASPLRPYLARVDETPKLDSVSALRAVLEQRRPAFVTPENDGRVAIWAGAETETDAHALARSKDAVREFLARDRASQVTPTDLFLSVAEVHVDGLDPEQLPRIRHLEHPIPALLSQGASYGATTLVTDPDGEVRGLYQLVNYTPDNGPGHLLPSAPLAAAMELAHSRVLRYRDGILHVGDAFAVPMDATGFSLIRWDAEDTARDARGSLRHSISAWRVIVDLFDRAAGLPLHYQHDVGGKVVVVADATRDSAEVATPIGDGVPNGAVLGQALANVLDSEGITRTPVRSDLVATLALAFAGALLALAFAWLLRSGPGAVLFFSLPVLTGSGYLWFARQVFVHHHLWIAAAGPIVALAFTFAMTTLYAARTEREIQDFIQHALGRYVSPDVSRAVLRNLKLIHPERCTATLLRCDLEGFGRACEELPPLEVASLLNAFLGEMTRVVREKGGQVEYAGDAMLAFWGAPVRTERHAQLACETALELREVLEKRRGAWEKRFGRKIEFRIGIATGDVVAGDLGCELKSNYTAVGEPVNLATRLENANAVYGTRVLISGSTAERVQGELVVREIDEVMLRGSPQRLFELIARKKELSKPELARLREYEAARALYKDRHFQEALAHFERLSGDAISALYVERCRQYLVTPPPPDWHPMGELRKRAGN